MYEFVADQFLGINGLINFSNIVFLVAFSVRDVLKLRILAIVGWPRLDQPERGDPSTF